VGWRTTADVLVELELVLLALLAPTVPTVLPVLIELDAGVEVETTSPQTTSPPTTMLHLSLPMGCFTVCTVQGGLGRPDVLLWSGSILING
jgi:hypothetical protein